MQKKKDSADQSEITPFDEYIFFARSELSRENKNERTKPDLKNKWNHQKTILGVWVVGILFDKLRKLYMNGTVM